MKKSKVLIGTICALTLGVGAITATAINGIDIDSVNAADTTDSIKIKGFAGSTTSAYVTSKTSDSTQLGYVLEANNYNPGNGQIRGNKTGLVNFYIANTSSKGAGYYIKSVTLKCASESLVTNAADRTMCKFAASAIATTSLPTGGQSADTSADTTTSATWTVSDAATNNFGYFCIYNIKTSGTALASADDAISITYGSAGVANDVVTEISATPATKTYTAGDTVEAAHFAVTATKNSVPNTSYANFRSEIGTISGSNYVKRGDVSFGTTTVSANDNVIRFFARDTTADGGSEYAHFDVSLTVNLPTLTGLTISDSTATINKSETKQLSVTTTPAEADPSVTWASSDTGIATVDSNGLVTAVAKGSANITATSTTVNTINAVCAVTVVEPTVYNLVTSLDQLTNGAKVVIANATGTYVMSGTQASNNRGAISATTASDVLTPSAGYGEFTVGKVTGATADSCYYTLKDGNGFLYAASSSSNYMKSETKLSSNSKWEITLTDGAFSIVSKGGNTHNTMKYNSISTLFSCYSSGQDAVALYILPNVVDTAASFGTDYIDLLTCDNGVTAPDKITWSSFGTRFTSLSDTEKALLTGATANADGTAIEKCVARYDYVLSKYGTTNYANYLNRVIPQNPSISFGDMDDDKSAIVITSIISVLAVAATGAFFFIRKKKEA